MATIVRYSKEDPPIASLIVHNFISDQSAKTLIKFNGKAGAQTAELAFPTKDRDILRGDRSIASYLVRSQPLTTPLYTTDPRQSSDIDQWLFGVGTLDILERHLTLRSFISGYTLTLADIYMFSLILKTRPENLSSTPQSFPNIHRWFLHVLSTLSFPLSSIISFDPLSIFGKVEATQSAPQQQAPTKQHSKAKYQPLENAEEGKVVTRFPPEPSGWLHLGHAKAALLNKFYADHYKGKMIIRFDDTNPAKENDEFVNSIRQDLNSLGINVNEHKVTYTSDYFDQIESYAKSMIQENTAYVDKSTKDQMQQQRKNLLDSPFRTASKEENLRLFEEMKKGSPEGQKCVLRAKINNQSVNGTMRDPAIYRVVVSPAHHRTGTKYKMYPTYDFACPIVDSLEGITHALRSNEYHDRNEQYNWFLKHLSHLQGVEKLPIISDYSRLNFEYTLLSKRKLQWFVDSKIVTGWDDPSFPTVRGCLRRGLTAQALKDYIYAQGSSMRGTNQTMDKLWSINKQLIDRNVPRYWAIPDDQRVKFTILTPGLDTIEYKSIPFHKQNSSLGWKVVPYYKDLWIEKTDAAVLKQGTEFTLMDWGNCIVKEIKTSSQDTAVVEEVFGELNLKGDYKTTELKATWLIRIEEREKSGSENDLVEIEMREYGNLITKDKLEDGDVLEQYVNKGEILRVKKGWGDMNMRGLRKGERIQLERRGFWICDEDMTCPREKVVLIKTPDGAQKKAFD